MPDQEWADKKTLELLGWLGYTTVYRESGTLAFYYKDMDRLKKAIAQALTHAYERGRKEREVIDAARNLLVRHTPQNEDKFVDALSRLEKETKP